MSDIRREQKGALPGQVINVRLVARLPFQFQEIVGSGDSWHPGPRDRPHRRIAVILIRTINPARQGKPRCGGMTLFAKWSEVRELSSAGSPRRCHASPLRDEGPVQHADRAREAVRSTLAQLRAVDAAGSRR